MTEYELTVEGMSCTGCEETVVEAASGVAGVERAEADHEAGTVRVQAADGSDTEAAVRRAIDDAGYEVVA